MKSLAALERHQHMLERSLADLKARKNTEHLSALDIAQMSRGLEKRLSIIKRCLTSNDPMHSMTLLSETDVEIHVPLSSDTSRN